MKTLPMLVAALVYFAAQAAFANPDEVEQELTPQQLCESYAKEDGITDEDYAGYMQDCITSFEEMPAGLSSNRMPLILRPFRRRPNSVVLLLVLADSFLDQGLEPVAILDTGVKDEAQLGNRAHGAGAAELMTQEPRGFLQALLRLLRIGLEYREVDLRDREITRDARLLDGHEAEVRILELRHELGELTLYCGSNALGAGVIP